MRDIGSTIQPDQDDIVRADIDASSCVQGAPGTGETAVGLHRVAYLLSAYRDRMSRGGVLVVGPNRAFLSYIGNVLPALGELDVAQSSVTDLLASVPVRAADEPAAARIKGEARMAEVLRRALVAGRLLAARRAGRGAARARGPLRHRAGDALPPDRARGAVDDGRGRGELRRPDARGGQADPACARRGGPDVAQGRPGPAGVQPAVRP